MDPDALAGLIFTLLLAMIIGGFVLLYPLSRKLGQLLEQRVNKQPLDAGAQQELSDLRQMLEGMQAELAQIQDRQEFVEGLMSRSDRADAGKLKP